jgi:hypothetical protein
MLAETWNFFLGLMLLLICDNISNMQVAMDCDEIIFKFEYYPWDKGVNMG